MGLYSLFIRRLTFWIGCYSKRVRLNWYRVKGTWMWGIHRLIVDVPTPPPDASKPEIERFLEKITQTVITTPDDTDR
jgi:hypothetical protein